MASQLLLCVGQDNYDAIQGDIAKLIEEQFAVKQSQYEQLVSETSTLHADYEQRCYELDKKIIETSSALEKETARADKLSQDSDSVQNELKKLKESNEALETNLTLVDRDRLKIKRERDAFQEEQLSIEHILQKRETQLAKMTEEWKLVSDKLNKSVDKKNELEIKYDDLQSKTASFEYEQKKMLQEKELLESRNEQLSIELGKLTTETSAAKLERSGELVNLKGKLEEKMGECNLLSSNLNGLRATNAQYQEKINQLLEKLNKAQEEHVAMEELYKKELQSQSNLAELYKSAAEDAEAKASELSSAVSELQHLIGSSSEANAIAQQQINEMEIKNVNNIREIENLKKEIEMANDLITATKSNFAQNLTEEELGKLCPTAAMASKFIKSGMTLTEIYSKYIETSDELDVVKLENKRLNEAMDSILSELNEKAPVLKKQRDDYERALATISQLTSQMDNAVIECQHLQTRTDDANRKFGVTQRDNQRLRKETVDLSKQVQYLLKELSELKGGTITMGAQSSDGSMQDDELSSTVITSSDVISSRLVTFKDISELQQQNKNLLAVVRELSEEKEKDEALTTNSRITELSETLDDTKGELENMKLERSRQGDMIEVLVRQRDMYRVLLAKDSDSSNIPPSIIASPSLLTKSPKFPSSDKSDDNHDTSRALTSLQKEFNEFKVQSQGNVKIYKEQIDELHKNSSELRTSSAKFQALAEFRAESGEILKQNNKDLKNENQILKNRSNQQQILLQKQELSLVDTCNKLSTTQQSKAKVDAKLEASTTEINMLKRTEERLRSEISFLSKEQRGQSVLLANLQKVQQTVERQEFEVRTQMRQQIESQENELKSLRNNLQQVKEDKQDAIHSIEKQLFLVQNQYEKECEKFLECNKSLQAEIEKYQNCDLEKNQLQAKLTTIEKRMKNLSDIKGMSLPTEDGDNEETVKELKEDCKALKEELQATKLKLDKATNAIQQQKSIAAALEESLKQANASNKELSDALNTRLSSANEQILQVEKKAAELYSDNLKLASNKTDLINEVDRQTEGLNKQIAVLQTELDDVMNKLKVAQKCEQEARRELQEQALAAKEAIDNYQREMVQHGINAQQLLKLKETAEKYESEISNYQTKLKENESQLNAQKELLPTLENKYKIELNDVKERATQMETQNGVLHERIEYLSNQLSEAQQKASKVPTYMSPIKNTSTSYLDDDDKAKSDEQLMNIVKFLRKEKALYESKFDVASMENKRIKHQFQNLESQVQEVQRKLRDEQQKCNELSQKEMEHEAVVKKLETLNILTDSNRLLRDERDKLVSELNNMTDLLENVQKQLSPLKSSNSDLTMQNNSLKSEKTALEQDVQRWQQRVQTITQKKQDPEELKKQIAERQQLIKNLERLAKELQEKKNELSASNAEVRNSANEVTTLKTEKSATETKLKNVEKDIEEKNKIIGQVKRVGRRYKLLYEDLQKKTQEAEKQQAATKPESTEPAIAISQKTEESAKLSLLEASIGRANTAKAQLQKQLTTANQTIEEQEKKIEQLTKELSEAKENADKQSSSGDEVASAKKENEDLKKMLSDKDDKSKKLLAVAKNRLEQIRKELSDSNNAKEKLQTNEINLKKQLNEITSNERIAKDERDNLQKKVDELQKQLQSHHQMKLGNEARGRQIPQYNPSSGSGDRKAANVRPISTTLVSQVSPLRVTKLARVMPEPHQDVVEGTSTSTEPIPTRVSSPQTHVSTSHMSTVSSVVPQSSTQPTRALVHPTRHRVSSAIPTPSASTSSSSRSDTQTDSPVIISVSSEVGNASAPSSSTGSSGNSSRPSEIEQAIVSSSDDQTVFQEEEDGSISTNQQSSISQTESSHQSSIRMPSEAAPSSSVTKVYPSRSKPFSIASQDSKSQENQGSEMAASSSDSKVAVVSVQSVQDRKRTHDDVDDEATASSSDSQISMIPVSKRQRNSPDQSSESVAESQPQLSEAGDMEGQVSEIESDNQAHMQSTSADVEESTVTRVQPIRPLIQTESSTLSPATSSLQPLKSASSTSAEQSSVCASTSDEQPVGDGDNAVIISSDEEAEATPQGSNEAEQTGTYYGEEYQDGMLDEVSESNQQESIQETVEVVETSTNQLTRPSLVINPPPPDSVPRNRIPPRPAPLTPGLPMIPSTNVLPSTNDDGDGIVPCTPTLPSHAHDDNYQTINSPYLTSGSGPPIQFRFEDVNVPAQSSLGAQRGLGSVDNTLMDLGGTDEETPQTIPNIDVIQSSESVAQSYGSRSMVSSSFVEDVIEESGKQDEGDDGQEEDAKECSSSDIPEPVAVRNLQNLRGRRIRLIKSRPRGRGGGNSPTTSNN